MYRIVEDLNVEEHRDEAVRMMDEEQENENVAPQLEVSL